MGNETMFWLGAAGMIVLAMLFLLPPLLGRTKLVSVARRETNLAIFQQRLEELKQDLEGESINQEQFGQAEADLKRELLSDLEEEEQQAHQDSGAGRLAAVAVLVAVPVIAIGVYTQIGSPEAVDVQAASQRAEAKQGKVAFEDAVAQLEKKLAQDPSNLEGWMMLAKSYRYLGRNAEIVKVYQRALSHFGDHPDPQLLLDYGEALADQQQGAWEGEPMVQLQRALEIDPNHADVLWFAGHIHFDMGKPQQALGYWERLSKVVPQNDDEVISMINQAAAKAQQQLGLPQQPLIAVKAAPAASGATLSVAVSLDPVLVGTVSPEDTVFVFAKAIGRKGPPLAAKRLTVADLPATVLLDDSLAMMPGNNLSSVERVIVGAKITKSGVATGGSGDLLSSTESATSNSETIQLQISAAAE
ncbi:MAG: c-type cytochrome biogenesis protein CcmI [Gammaproteobacteria bacterium]|jgi:cytochrome c-type biogenesis protein CcmH|nr:c-type cytochrome biogenesis protein CcmI [Gammaproteobacteria bacterium]MBT4607937.1 c-type cytochrome biogenesis protein CcmI [Thiotrichales bacterium]MBT3472271.1 c-type cytochrome biogenesis protein CcmI [Gammaproteobacteria bacterium]MBT3966932.1 c-type cytochrome biogenesis protein CcmI [Gammaproteobacteria bacterium]MBT4329060.1 c-type cytochrome biogenesis protein CcmI [Gammaproteobacteria bacterium]